MTTKKVFFYKIAEGLQGCPFENIILEKTYYKLLQKGQIEISGHRTKE